MEYKIIRSKRRTIALEINSQAEVMVRAPLRASDVYIDNLVQKRKEGILEKVMKAKKRMAKRVPKIFKEKEEFLFLGKKYEIKVSLAQKEKMVFDDGFGIKESEMPKAKELIVKGYKKEALNYFFDRTKEMAEEFGFECGKVWISNAQKRWGTCNFKNDIRINWRLIMAPAEVVDYVILHELVHTKIKNHSKRYWNEVQRLMPEYKKCEKWIKENRFELMSICLK